MLKQITSTNGLIGRTITKVKQDYNNLILVFDNGTFSILQPEGYDDPKVTVDIYSIDPVHSVYVELGITTQHEQQEAIELERIEDERRNQEYEQEEKDRIEAYERRLLSDLQAKYANKEE